MNREMVNGENNECLGTFRAIESIFKSEPLRRIAPSVRRVAGVDFKSPPEYALRANSQDRTPASETSRWPRSHLPAASMGVDLNLEN